MWGGGGGPMQRKQQRQVVSGTLPAQETAPRQHQGQRPPHPTRARAPAARVSREGAA